MLAVKSWRGKFFTTNKQLIIGLPIKRNNSNPIVNLDNFFLSWLLITHHQFFLLSTTGRMSRQNLGAIEYHRDDPEETTTLPPTYIVIKIASDIPDKTVLWLVEKIRAKRRDGGAELMVFREPYNPEEVSTTTSQKRNTQTRVVFFF